MHVELLISEDIDGNPTHDFFGYFNVVATCVHCGGAGEVLTARAREILEKSQGKWTSEASKEWALPFRFADPHGGGTPQGLVEVVRECECEEGSAWTLDFEDIEEGLKQPGMGDVILNLLCPEKYAEAPRPFKVARGAPILANLATALGENKEGVDWHKPIEGWRTGPLEAGRPTGPDRWESETDAKNGAMNRSEEVRWSLGVWDEEERLVAIARDGRLFQATG